MPPSKPLKKLKVLTLIGTRPELIKLSRVIHELDETCEHVLVHSGQNYDFELNEIFFQDLNIRKPDHFLSAATGEVFSEDIANVIMRLAPILDQVEPDAFLFYGDTNTTLGAIVAKRKHIPLFHMEAGNRCFDERVPEEINRKIVDHISDINLTISEHARRYLLQEGLRGDTVIKVGSCMAEIFNYHREKIEQSKILQTLNLKSGQYFLMSAHREENVDNKMVLQDLLATLRDIIDTYQQPIIFPMHPRTKKRLEAMDFKRHLEGYEAFVQFPKPFGFCDYVHLMCHAGCVLSDSGSLTEDASLLNIPAVMIRQSHERPEGMDVGTLVMSGCKSERVLQAIELVMRHAATIKRPFNLVPDYQECNVSQKVVRIIHSYVDYINRTVWYS